MNRMLLLISSVFISASFAATIGGYGELHWDVEGEKMDFHRFVLFYGHAWDEEWSFKAEVELEHNMVKGGTYDGELELEQAYVSFYNGSWGWKGGVVLAPVGIINVTHEPPTFLSVERPFYHSQIIPTTWFGNGFSFYGSINDFTWEVTMMEDLKGQSILDCGLDDDGYAKSYAGCIRKGRGKGDVSTATSLTKIFTVSWTGLDGLRVGGSFTINEAPTNDANKPLDVTLMEINSTYSKNNIHNVFEWATGKFENGTTSWTSNGYYLDLGYNLGNMIAMEGKTLMPWFRTSTYTLDDSNTANDVDILLYGVTYKPNSSVSIKMNMGNSEANGIESDIFAFGIGYMF